LTGLLSALFWHQVASLGTRKKQREKRKETVYVFVYFENVLCVQIQCVSGLRLRSLQAFSSQG
jgi:hypothetical protein